MLTLLVCKFIVKTFGVSCIHFLSLFFMQKGIWMSLSDPGTSYSFILGINAQLLQIQVQHTHLYVCC